MAVIKQQTQIFNQPIGVTRASNSAGLANTVSNVVDQMLDRRYNVVAGERQRAGEKAGLAATSADVATLGEDGLPVAYQAPQGSGRLFTQAYQDVIDRRFATSVQMELKERGAEILKTAKGSDDWRQRMESYVQDMADAGIDAEGAPNAYSRIIAESSSEYIEGVYSNLQQREREAARARLAQQTQLGLYSSELVIGQTLAAGGDASAAIADHKAALESAFAADIISAEKYISGLKAVQAFNGLAGQNDFTNLMFSMTDEQAAKLEQAFMFPALAPALAQELNMPNLPVMIFTAKGNGLEASDIGAIRTAAAENRTELDQYVVEGQLAKFNVSADQTAEAAGMAISNLTTGMTEDQKEEFTPQAWTKWVTSTLTFANRYSSGQLNAGSILFKSSNPSYEDFVNAFGEEYAAGAKHAYDVMSPEQRSRLAQSLGSLSNDLREEEARIAAGITAEQNAAIEAAKGVFFTNYGQLRTLAATDYGGAAVRFHNAMAAIDDLEDLGYDASEAAGLREKLEREQAKASLSFVTEFYVAGDGLEARIEAELRNPQRIGRSGSVFQGDHADAAKLLLKHYDVETILNRMKSAETAQTGIEEAAVDALEEGLAGLQLQGMPWGAVSATASQFPGLVDEQKPEAQRRAAEQWLKINLGDAVRGDSDMANLLEPVLKNPAATQSDYQAILGQALGADVHAAMQVVGEDGRDEFGDLISKLGAAERGANQVTIRMTSDFIGSMPINPQTATSDYNAILSEINASASIIGPDKAATLLGAANKKYYAALLQTYNRTASGLRPHEFDRVVDAVYAQQPLASGSQAMMLLHDTMSKMYAVEDASARAAFTATSKGLVGIQEADKKQMDLLQAQSELFTGVTVTGDGYTAAITHATNGRDYLVPADFGPDGIGRTLVRHAIQTNQTSPQLAKFFETYLFSTNDQESELAGQYFLQMISSTSAQGVPMDPLQREGVMNPTLYARAKAALYVKNAGFNEVIATFGNAAIMNDVDTKFRVAYEVQRGSVLDAIMENNSGMDPVFAREVYALAQYNVATAGTDPETAVEMAMDTVSNQLTKSRYTLGPSMGRTSFGSSYVEHAIENYSFAEPRNLPPGAWIGGTGSFEDHLYESMYRVVEPHLRQQGAHQLREVFNREPTANDWRISLRMQDFTFKPVEASFAYGNTPSWTVFYNNQPVIVEGAQMVVSAESPRSSANVASKLRVVTQQYTMAVAAGANDDVIAELSLKQLVFRERFTSFADLVSQETQPTLPTIGVTGTGPAVGLGKTPVQITGGKSDYETMVDKYGVDEAERIIRGWLSEVGVTK